MIDYLKNKYTAYKKRGFTLIELIVVMAIVAVLVLFAAPKFIGQTNTAQDRNIQNDVKVAEMKVSEALIDGLDVWDSWIDDGVTDVTSDTLKEFIGENGTTIYGRGGPIYKKDDIEGGGYRVLPGTFIEQEIRSRLEGTFYANKNGTVYYESGVVRQAEVDKKEPEYPDEETRLIKEEEYIPIATAEELNSIRSNTPQTYGKGTDWEKEYTGGLDKKYIQVDNIDLSGYWNPIGTYVRDDTKSSFTGTYDGGNYVITGLVVDSEREYHQGLFGGTNGATIRNVGLIDNKVTGREYVGGLVGRAHNSTISDSYATGKVTSTLGNAGGLVGEILESTIENSYATGSVESIGSRVGGLVGSDRDSGSSTISNSYATGSVKGRQSVGGLVGWVSFSSTISNSYATGSVEGSENLVGGLLGAANNSTEISNSYWDTETTGQDSSSKEGVGKSEGKSTDEMKLKATYSGWDFENVWKIDEGNDYPKLR